MPSHSQPAPLQKGFTLVEMAIVIVIIGLLIGGVLKGQEIMNASKVNATIKELQSLDSAISIFYQKYSQLPGDLDDADDFLPNCAGGACYIAATGNNNGDLEEEPTDDLANTEERFLAFPQLAAAGLISGVENTTTIEVGRSIPSAPVGGAFTIGTLPADTTGDEFYESGTYLAVVKSVSAAGAIDPAVLFAADAARIDRKLDDGVARTGRVILDDNGDDCAACLNGAEYDQAETTAKGSIAVKTAAP